MEDFFNGVEVASCVVHLHTLLNGVLSNSTNDLPSKIGSKSDLLTKLKRPVMGLAFLTPSHIFHSVQLSHLPINRAHQLIYNSLQIPEHFRISLLPLILFISYIFSFLIFFEWLFVPSMTWLFPDTVSGFSTIWRCIS